MAEQNQTINIEQDLSRTPLSTDVEVQSPVVPIETPEEEQVPPVAPLEVSREVPPVQPEAPQPVQQPATPVPPEPAVQQAPQPAVPITVQPPQPVDEFTGVEEQAIERASQLPAIFGTYSERRNTVTEQDATIRAAELRRIQGEVARSYTEGVLMSGDKTKDEGRRRLIRESSFVGIPKLDAKGNIMKDANGVPVLLERYALPATSAVDPEQRYVGNVIGTFEFANNPNGVYLFYDGTGNMPTGGINLSKEIETAKKQVQDLIPRVFARDESMQGGMAFYDEILRKAGVTRPEKRLYYLRAQAASRNSMFEGIESRRLDVMMNDMIPGLWNFGMMVGDVATNHTLSIPVTMMSVMSEMTPMGTLVDHGFFDAKGFGFGAKGITADMVIDQTKRFVRGTRTMPLFTMTAEQWAKREGVSVSEAEAVLGYTKDIGTAIGRFTLETAITAPTIIKSVRHLDNQTYREFSDFVATNYKKVIDGSWDGEGVAPSEAMDLVQISEILEKEGILFKDAFDAFAESRNFGSRAWLEGSIERAINNRLASVGPERAAFYGDRTKAVQTKISDYSSKIRQAESDVKSATTKKAREKLQQRLDNLKTQKRRLVGELNELTNSEITPPFVRDFLVDELAIATPIAGITYGTLYQATGGDELVPGLAAFVSVIGSLNPRFRRGMQWSAESLKYAGHSVLNKAGILSKAPPNKEAVILARRLKGANPELRDRIYAFMSDVSNAVEKYGNVRYPEGHPQAGQPILTEDVLYQSFSMMSGLSTLRALQEQAASTTVNLKDVGQFKAELEQIQGQFDERARMVDQLGQVVQNLKYLEFNTAFDPNSEAGDLVRTLKGVYEVEQRQLQADTIDFNNIINDQAPIEKIFSADARVEDVQEFISGNKSIAVALAVEMRRFQKYNIDPNLSPVEQEKALQAHLQQVQTNVAEAFARHEKFEASKDRTLANQDFVNFINTQEVIAYTEGSNQFDKLRAKFPEDARIDLTDIHDQIVLGEIELDMDVVDMVVPALADGSDASRAFARMNIDSRTGNALRRLFRESANEYMDYFRTSADEPTLQAAEAIFESLEIVDADDYTKMLALREGFKSAGMEDFLPRLGVDVSQLVQIVSGLGRTAAVRGDQAARPINQLRQSILERGDEGFYTDFYGPNRTRLEGFGDEYKSARTFYKTRYIDPFRNENTTIRKIVKSGENFRDLDLSSLDRFVKHFELNQRKSAKELEALQNQLASVIGRRNEDGSVAPLDVNTPEGQQVRSILTQLVIEELSNTMGGQTFRKALADKRGGITGKTQAMQEFAEGVREGTVKPESGINLANLIGRNSDGTYRLADANGNPLVNIQEVDYFLSFDNIKRFVDEAEEAETKFFEELGDAKTKWKKEFDLESGSIRRELLAREKLVDQLGSVDGGLGAAVLKQFNTDAGPAKIVEIREDFVRTQVEKGVPEKEARDSFRQVIQQSVIDALYEQVSKPGDKVAFQVKGETETKRLGEIVPERLLELIGYRGDTVEATRTEKAIRELLGDEVYDHLRFVGETLYVSDSAVKKMNVTGLARPLSAESQLSRITSYFRGVISLRWLISEAAIREARRSNAELTKLMLFDPKVGREVLDLVISENFSAERFAQVYPVLISQIAKNDVLMEGAYTMAQERENENRQMTEALRAQQIDEITAPTDVESQMNQLQFTP